MINYIHLWRSFQNFTKTVHTSVCVWRLMKTRAQTRADRNCSNKLAEFDLLTLLYMISMESSIAYEKEVNSDLTVQMH